MSENDGGKAGMIFNIQHFSIHDGPGIRTTVFMKGCPLDCIWCHNPESKSFRPQLSFTKSKCVGCGACVKACPHGCHAIEQDGGDFRHVINRTDCSLCGSCCAACSYSALEITGRLCDPKSVIEDVLRDRIFYETSGGGVTFSGGEPTAQPEFLKEMLVLAKQSGLHTAVETCGYVRTDILLDLAGYVDLFLFDYKETDPGLHKKYTGRDNALIIENLSTLNEAGAEIILRCPLIPGLNTDDAHMKGIADTAERLSSVKEIQLEPYHPLGISKAGAIGIAPAYENAEFMDKTLAEECRDKISKLTVKPVRIM